MRDLPRVEWDGKYRDGRLDVRMSEARVLARLSALGPPPWWEGGPMFGKEHAVSTNGSRFTLSLRHSRGRLPRLEGEVEATTEGSVIRYEVVTARVAIYVFLGFFVLPVLGVGGLSLLLMALGKQDEAAGMLVGIPLLGCLWLPLGLAITTLVFFLHRTAALSLHRYFRRQFEDVVILQAEAVE